MTNEKECDTPDNVEIDMKKIPTEVLLSELNKRFGRFKRTTSVPICIAVENEVAEICQRIPPGMVLSMQQFTNIQLFALEWQRKIVYNHFFSHNPSELGTCPDATLLAYFTVGHGCDLQEVVYLDAMCNIHRVQNTNMKVDDPMLARIMDQSRIPFFLNLHHSK